MTNSYEVTVLMASEEYLYFDISANTKEEARQKVRRSDSMKSHFLRGWAEILSVEKIHQKP